MFTPFSTTKAEGLGIGLAISRSIVEAHGGRLWAERRPGAGLAVQFTLPAWVSKWTTAPPAPLHAVIAPILPLQFPQGGDRLG